MQFRIVRASCVVSLLALAAVIGAARADSPSASPVRVQVIRNGDEWQLKRDGKPYFIRGAGGAASKQLLAQLGGNSFRTWGANDINDQLDEAQRLGLTVTIGVWLRHEGDKGFTYGDAEQVAHQYELTRQAVQRYKDHPALLIWALGNETEGFKAGDDPRIWKAINDVAALTKKLDPNHPTMTVIAEVGGARVKSINDFCPDIDIVGINSYGGVASVGERYKKAGGVKPYVITEFGPPGTWESGKNAWGIPIEPTSTRKGQIYRDGYQKGVLAEKGLCLGSYVFTWGNKQEATATWYGLFLPDGSQLEPVHTMAELWTGHAPANQCPKIKAPKLEGSDQVAPNQIIHATLDVSDPDGDPLTVMWVLSNEAKKPAKPGGDLQPEPPSYPDAILSIDAHQVEVKAPHEPGTYRLFAYARDDHGNAATANIVFRVNAIAATTPQNHANR
jgi:hypothetical protein